MATKKKLNVKFIAIILGALGLGLAIVGGIVLVQYKNDPLKHIAKGDELMAEGLPEKAARQYLLGIGKAPFEMAYYDKAITAFESIEPETDIKSMEEFNNLLAVLLAKAEKAAPQDGKDAETVRAEVLDRVLDEGRVFVFGREREPLADRDRVYSDLSRRFQVLDAAMRRAPGVDPRLAAAVRGYTLEAAWRASPLQTDSQWDGSMKRLREAIALDPTYVPNWYGLLRGQLDRFEMALVETGPRAASRSLSAEDGLLATLTQAREAIGDQPAPEIDLIEAQLGQVVLYAGAAGDGPMALMPTPDTTRLAGIIENVSALAGLDAWEARWRLEELRANGMELISRAPSNRTDAAILTDYRDAGLELLKTASKELRGADPEDGRSILLRLGMARIPGVEEDGDGLKALIADSVERERGFVSLNTLLHSDIRRLAARTALTVALEPAVASIRNQQEVDPADVAAVVEGLAGVEEAFRDDGSDVTSPVILQARLVTATMLGIDAKRKGDDAGSAEYLIEASRASSMLRQSPEVVLDGLTVDAAMILAEARGEYGQALALLQSTINANPEVADDLGIQTRFVEMLAKAGRADDARGLLNTLRGRAAAVSDSVVLERLAEIEERIVQQVEGVDLATVKGADLLAAESEASLRGDLDERRRLLDQVIDDPEVMTAVRVRALIRRAQIEATVGDFSLARQYAGRVLEIEPGNSMARLIMASDASTGMLDRYRILAENAAPDDKTRDVMLAGMIRAELRSGVAKESDEKQTLEAEYRRLLDSMTADPEPGPEMLRFLAGVALDEGRTAEASRLADRLLEVEPEPSSLSVLLRARIARKAGDTDAAISIVRKAIEDQGLGTDSMFVLLGEFLALKGERDASRDAYQQAFELAPTRPYNAMALASALMAEGRSDEALPVLRAARSAGREDPGFLDAWLLQEMRAGNHGTAIQERRRRYEFAPIDFRNATALIQLLTESPIGRVDVIWTEESAAGRRGVRLGEPRFDEVSWSRLSPSERQGAVLETQRLRRAEADAIVRRMLELDGTNPQVVTAASAFFRSSPGDEGVELAKEMVNTAIEQLRSRLDENPSSDTRLRDELRLSRILATQAELAISEERFDDAATLFAEAARIEGDRSSDVDTIASSLYMRNRMFEEAAEYQRRLLAEREAAGSPISELREIARRLIEVLVEVGETTAAEPIVDRYFRGETPSASDLMSLGAFAYGQADNARRLRTEADDYSFLEKIMEAESYYRQAASLRANDLNIDFALLKLAEYRWRWCADAERPTNYATLRDFARDFVQRHADNWSARRSYTQVLMLRGGGDGSDGDTIDRRFSEAMVQLREFLEIEPGNVEARVLLIDSLSSGGQPEAALDVAQAALDREPNNRVWAGRVGRIRTELRQFDAAARQFGLLFQQTGDDSYLQMQINALMERDPPDADAVIGLARANGQSFARQPFLAAMYAAAMAQTGRRDLALKNFESLYRSTRDKGGAANANVEESRTRMSLLAAALPKLFPLDESGVQDLEVFVDTISGGSPTVSDLLAVASAWQLVAERNSDSASPDPELAKRADEASMRLLRRGSIADPEHPETLMCYRRLGVLMQRLDDCAGSVEAFEQAFRLQPESPEASNNLAYLLLVCGGDLERARKLAAIAVERRPATAEYRDTYGGILKALGDQESDPDRRKALLQQARDELQQSTRLGKSPAPWIKLAELELNAGRLDAARSALLRAGDQDPDAAQQEALDALTRKLGTSE